MRATQTTEAAAPGRQRGPLPSGHGHPAGAPHPGSAVVLPTSLPPRSGTTGACEFSGEGFLLKLRPQEDTWPVSPDPLVWCPARVLGPQVRSQRKGNSRSRHRPSAPGSRPQGTDTRMDGGRGSGSSDAASVPQGPASAPPTSGATSHPRQLPRAHPTTRPPAPWQPVSRTGFGNRAHPAGAPRPHAGHAGGSGGVSLWSAR